MDIVKSNYPQTPATATPASTDNKLHFLDYWRIIRVRKTVILTVFMLVVLTTTLVTQFLPPYYESHARIEVEKDIPDIEGITRSTVASGYDPYWMQTQFEIIQSSTILHMVIERLKLNEKFAERDKLPVPYSLDEAMLILKRQLDLNQYRNTTLIEIKVYSQKPEEAAEIANAIAEAYKEYRQKTRTGTVENAIKELRQQYAVEEAKFTNKLNEVEQLRKECTLNDIDPFSMRATTTIEAENLRRLEAQRIDVEAQYLEMLSLYRNITNMTEFEYRNAIQTASPDPELASSMEQLSQAEQQRIKMEGDYGEEHPSMIQLNLMISNLNKKVSAKLDGIKKGLHVRVVSLEDKLKAVDKSLSEAKEKERKGMEQLRIYNTAKEDLYTLRQVKDAFQLRITAVETDNLKIPTTVVRVVDKAVPGIRPVRPHKILNISLGVVAGLLLGIGLAFFIEYLDTSVKTIDEVERALQAPVLGVIPQNVRSLLTEGPESPHAEAYRVLRTNLLFSRKEDTWNTLTIVSGGAGEGKSTTLFNLAVIFAQNGARVLLVDSDLRRPSLHKILNVSNSAGLTNYLLKQNTLAEVIQTTNVPTLDFLPSGKLPSSAMGILNSNAMKEMIAEVKRRYDFVFFDSPPIMGISDASILASEVDMTMQVVQYRRYPQPMTMRAKQMIEKVGGNLMGIVLNNINMSQDSYYYYYSGYFEESYYKSDEEKTGKSSRSGRSAKKDKVEVAATDVEIKQKY